MESSPARPSSFLPFVAGALAPVVVAGALLAFAGDDAFARIRSLGVVGAIIGGSVFLLTVVLPCALLGALGRSPGIVGGFARGLLLPLGILAASAAARLDGSVPKALPEPAMENVLAESFRAVWTPGAATTLAPADDAEAESGEEPDAPSSSAAPTAAEERMFRNLRKLQDELEDVRRERDRLERRVRDLEGSGETGGGGGEAPTAAPPAGGNDALLRALRGELAAARATATRLQGQLRNAEKGLLDARREADEMRSAVLKAKEEGALALGDAKLVREKLEARIEELEKSELSRELEELRSRAFVPVGVVADMDPDSNGRGLAVRTGSVDASRVAGPGFVISPSGKVLAVLRIGVGRDEALAATVLFYAPAVRRLTPGDRVYAHVR